MKRGRKQKVKDRGEEEREIKRLRGSIRPDTHSHPLTIILWINHLTERSLHRWMFILSRVIM